jgi:hypothetical protein
MDSLDDVLEINFKDSDSKNILFSPGYPSGERF